jgi:hypothetical protein
MKAEAAKAYWSRNNFNPVNGVYYDASKEDTFTSDRETKAKVHGLDYCKKLPISVQK